VNREPLFLGPVSVKPTRSFALTSNNIIYLFSDKLMHEEQAASVTHDSDVETVGTFNYVGVQELSSQMMLAIAGDEIYGTSPHYNR
jgi:hypothetical protein